MKKLILLLLFIPLVSFGQTKIFINEDLTNSLKVHNQERELLGLSKLEWSTDLQKDAENYAKYLARTDTFKHSQQNNQGENLYLSYYSKTVNNITSNVFSKTPLKDASFAWYNEIKDYSYSAIKMDSLFPKIGHYTQMIWSSTKKVGIGKARSKSGKVYVVARYYPAGNILGKTPY